MVRPGVKEFLEKMDKLYEIVIFTASVSKYADPLLDIIDKKGYCPFRLFREHCSLINTTFVKDLQRLGRDLKNIVIVDNSPLSYALHPENGLPILTWFEDKSDRELYTIMPVLEFLSTVQDVREFIPKFVGKDNKINYERANEIMKNYNGPRIVINDTEEDGFNKNNNNIYKNNGKEINIQIISNNSNNNYIQHKIDKTNSNTNNNISNKENKDNNNGNKDKLVEMAMKNIIASVSPNQVAYNNSNTSSNTHSNPILRNKPNSKNKIYINNKKNSTVDEDKIPKEKNNIKININNSINVKKLINVNHTAHSTKKFKGSITDGNFKSKQKRKNYSTGGNYIKNGSINLNPDSKSIILKSENHNCNILVKSKNATPKINKTINLLNKSNHTTRSVKYTKKTNAYIIIPTPNNNTISKMSKSLTKNSINSFNNHNINKENSMQNKKIHKSNVNSTKIYKPFVSTGANYNGLLNHKKQKSSNEFKSMFENKKTQFKNSAEKPKKNGIKVENAKNKNNFLKTGFIQHKALNNKMNNININLSSNLTLSQKFHNNSLNMNNINSFDYTKTNRGSSKITFDLANNNILKTNYGKNYSPNNRYNEKNLEKNNIFNNQNIYSKTKISYKHNSIANNKGNIANKNKENNKKIIIDQVENSNNNGINRIKTARPKSSTTIKIENKNNASKNQNIFENKKNKAKYQSKMRFEINEILQKRGISGKINDLKKEIKKA
jgi:Dullard-like phosphatase family protein